MSLVASRPPPSSVFAESGTAVVSDGLRSSPPLAMICHCCGFNIRTGFDEVVICSLCHRPHHNPWCMDDDEPYQCQRCAKLVGDILKKPGAKFREFFDLFLFFFEFFVGSMNSFAKLAVMFGNSGGMQR